MNPSISFTKPCDKPFGRPGVTDPFLKANGVYRTPGKIVKPYFTVSGKPVMRECDGGKQYCRWRLDVPLPDGSRYLQPEGSKPYGYVAPHFAVLSASDTLAVTEGSFKSLSLLEAGVAAVGIPGINGAFQDGQLIPGLREAVQHMALKRFLFVGDGDTSLLLSFSREAVKLARALPGIAVSCPRIGLNGPKGIDDCREALGDGFPAYWSNLVATAEPVSADDTAEQLALRLFLRESPEAMRKAAGY